MYVCMSVRNRFTIEMYEFTNSLHAFQARSTHTNATAMDVND